MITNNTFCYWDVKSDPDAIIMLINASISFIIFISTAYYTYIFWNKYASSMSNAKEVYNKFAWIFVWAISFWATVVYGVTVYFNQLRYLDDQYEADVTTYSAIYSFIETIPSIAVQTLLFITSKTILINSLGLMLSQGHQPTHSQRTAYKIVMKYTYIRLIILIAWASILLPYPQISTYQILTQIKILILMIDCIAVSSILLFCRKYTLSFSQKHLPSPPNLQKQVNNSTLLLVLCSIIRFFTCFIFYIIFPIVFSFMETMHQKPCIEGAQHHLEFTIGYLVIGMVFMQHLPVLGVLVIYRPIGIKVADIDGSLGLLCESLVEG